MSESEAIPKRTSLVETEEDKDLSGNHLEGLETEINTNDVFKLKFKQQIQINKSLNLELQSERNRIRKLLGDIGTLTTELATQDRQETSQFEAELSKKAKRIESLETSLGEFKVRYTCEKSENEKLKRIIRAECGENIDIPGLLNGHLVGWRGRAQTIIKLQDKLKEFVESDTTNRKEEDSNFLNPHVVLQNLEKEKREANDSLKSKISELEETLENKNLLLKSYKARILCLEEESKRTRDEQKIMKQKVIKDDEALSLLKDEVVKLKASEKVLRNSNLKSVSEGRFQEVSNKCDLLEVEVAKRDEWIVALQGNLENLEHQTTISFDRDISNHLSNTNLNLLKIESERLNELLNLFKNKYEQQTFEKESLQHRVIELERQVFDYQRNSRSMKNRPRLKLTKLGDLDDLRQKLRSQANELKMLRSSAAEHIAAKNEEIRILHKMNEDMKISYVEAVNRMKKEVTKQTSFSNGRPVSKFSPIRTKPKRVKSLEFPRIKKIGSVRSVASESRSYSSLYRNTSSLYRN